MTIGHETLALTRERLSSQEIADDCRAHVGTIADTASKVLMAKKRSRCPVWASVKVLCPSQTREPEPHYRTMARSSNFDASEYYIEEHLRAPRHLVWDNAIFRYILEREDHCLIPNIEAFVKEYSNWNCREPNFVRAPKMYTSALTLPIVGADPDADEWQLPDDIMTSAFRGGRCLLGFIGATSLAPDAFDAKFDLEIMRELAAQAALTLVPWYRVHSTAGFKPAVRLISSQNRVVASR